MVAISLSVYTWRAFLACFRCDQIQNKHCNEFGNTLCDLTRTYMIKKLFFTDGINEYHFSVLACFRCDQIDKKHCYEFGNICYLSRTFMIYKLFSVYGLNEFCSLNIENPTSCYIYGIHLPCSTYQYTLLRAEYSAQ
jgi:hypothetical protein